MADRAGRSKPFINPPTSYSAQGEQEDLRHRRYLTMHVEWRHDVDGAQEVAELNPKESRVV